MKLKNNALQELYATVVHCAITISPHAESLIEKAFRECDDEFSGSATFAHIKNLQERNDILEKTNGTLLSANMDLASEKKHLEKDLDDAKKQLNYFTNSRDDWRSRAKHAEKEVEDLKSRLNSIYGDEYIKKMQIFLNPDIRQMECFIKMCADMTVVDYPDRFGNKEEK